jgi:hypothetical protein
MATTRRPVIDSSGILPARPLKTWQVYQVTTQRLKGEQARQRLDMGLSHLARLSLANINFFEIPAMRHVRQRVQGARIAYRLSASGCFSDSGACEQNKS